MFIRTRPQFHFTPDDSVGGGDGAPDTGAPDTPPAVEPSTDATSATPADGESAEVAKWKAMARKHEDAEKALAKKLADVQQAQMTESEKAIETARSEGRTEAKREGATKVAAAELRAALKEAGVADPSGVIDALDLAKFVTDDGDIDDSAVAATKATFAALAPTPPGRPAGSADGGFQGAPPATPGQLKRSDLAQMTPEQIVDAKAKGLLAELLGA